MAFLHSLRFPSTPLILKIVSLAASTLAHGQIFYDLNGSAAGSGAANGGTWDGSAQWSSSADGTDDTLAWSDGATAVFSAGTDAAGDYTVTNSAARVIGGFTARTGQPKITGSSLQPATAAVPFQMDSSSAEIVSPITGTGGILKTGPGTLVLSGNNTFTGNLTISNGVLQLSPTGKLYNSAYNDSAVVTIATGGTWRLPNFSYAGVGQLSDYRQRRVLDGGVIEITGTTHASGQDFTATSNGGTFRYTTPGETLTLSGNANTNIQTNGPLTFDTTGHITIAGTSAIITGSGSLLKSGGGILTLGNGANSFSGALTINQGKLIANASSNFSNSPLGAKSASRLISVIGPGEMEWTLNDILGSTGLSASTLPAITVNSGTFKTTRYNAIGHLTLAGGTLLNAVVGDSTSYDGFQFLGTITADGVAPSAITTTVNRGNHLLGGGTTDIAVTDPAGQLTVSTILRNGSNSYPGAAALKKTGSGTLALTAANAYTGTTTVDGGTLQLSGSLAGATTVASGATLSGAGSAAAVTVQAGGTLAPDGSDTFSTAGLVLESGSNLTADGRATINGNLDINGATLTTSIPGPRVLLSYTGTRSGSFATASVPAGWKPAYDEAAKEIRLVDLLTNAGPVVNAGGDISTSNTTVTLAGSTSDDGLPASPGTLTTSWSKISGPGTVSFADESSPTSAVTLGESGTYVLRLSATDGAITATDELTLVCSLDPPVGAYARYTGTTGITTNGSGTITRWADQGGVAARDFVNVVGTPKTTTYALGGGTADVVRLDGTSALWAAAGTWGSLTGDRTVVARIRLKSTGNGFLFDGSTGSGKTRAQIVSGTWQAGVQATGAAWTATDLPTTAITADVWQTHLFEFDNGTGTTTVRHFIDGADVGGGSQAFTTALGGLILGANGGTSGRLGVDVAELIVYNRMLDAADKTAVTDYLQIRWGGLADVPLAFASATAEQTPRDISYVGIHGIAALKISSTGNSPAPGYALTQVVCNLNGTTKPTDIAELQLYAGNSTTFDSGTATKLAAIVAPGTGPHTFTVNAPITTGTARFWVAAKMKGSSKIGDLVDAEITSFTLTGAQAGTYAPTVTAPAGALTVNSLIYSTILHAEDQDGIHIYRIPGLATTNAGTIIATFDVRYTGGAGSAPDVPADIDVGIRRSTDGGLTWTPMQLIMDYDKNEAGAQGNGICDPTILVDKVTGRLWCAALWSKGNRGWSGSGPGLTPDETGQFLLNYSDDDGVTWSAPVSITSQIKDPAWRLYFEGPGKGICTREGTLIFPSQYRDAGGTARSNFIYSTDRGVTWNHGAPAIPGGSPNTSEAQIVELDNGDLLISMRDESRPGTRKWCVYSWNHTTQTIGQGAWGTPWSSQTDPTVMASVDRYRSKLDGHPYSALLFSNPDSTGRFNMTVRVSLDEGQTWPYKRKIDDRPAAYSCLTVLPDGDIGLLYETGATSSISDLTFVRFPIEWIVGTSDTDSDGMPDFYEDATGLNKNSAADAALDADGDGKSNLAEYQAKTDPFDAASRFEIHTINPLTGPARLRLKWTGMPYATYRVESSPSLAPGSWQPVPGLENVSRSTTGDLVVDLPIGSDPRLFYRVAVAE